MAIQDYEFYHGAVLAKILRNGNPNSLKLVETNKKESWATYTINDSVHMHMKHSSPTEPKKHIRWSFTFNKVHLQQLKKYLDKDLRFALICLTNKEEDYNSEICLLEKEEIVRLINFDSPTDQRINVYSEKGKPLYVDGSMSTVSKEIKVNRSAIDTISIPS